MKIGNFLDRINDPLDNDELLYKVLEAKYNNSSIYNTLSQANISDKEFRTGNPDNMKKIEDNKNQLELYLFNIWKKYVLNTDLNTIKPSYRDLFTQLQNSIKNYNPKDAEEVFDFTYNSNNRHSKELEDFIDQYGYKGLSFGSGWDQVSRSYLDFFNTTIPKIKHRLYLNINTTYIEKFAYIFTKKCFEKDLPFYYKYDDYATRADSFIIYSDSDNLFKYIQILEEIKKEYSKDVKENIKKPPILTANIDNWIGYGSEPLFKSKKKYSYTSLREKVFEKVLDRFNEKWTSSHKNGLVYINNNKVAYKEFFSKLLYNSYIESFNQLIKYTKDLDRVNYYGYSLNDTKKDGFRKQLMNMINKNIDYIIENIDNLDNYDHKKTITMKTRDNKEFYISSYDIKRAYNKQPLILSRMSDNFYNQFRAAVKKEGLKVNIPEDSFCFDKEALEDIKKLHEIEVKEELDRKEEIRKLEIKRQEEIKKLKKKKSQLLKSVDSNSKSSYRIKGITINGNLHIGGNVNIIVNDRNKEKNKQLVLNRGRK